MADISLNFDIFFHQTTILSLFVFSQKESSGWFYFATSFLLSNENTQPQKSSLGIEQNVQIVVSNILVINEISDIKTSIFLSKLK